MPIQNFPFLRPYTNDLKKRPWLPIIVHNPHKNQTIPTFGLIDTGADECAFPALYADMLGHNLTSGEPKQISTGNGQTTAYQHTCKVEVLDSNLLLENQQEIAYTIEETLIDFMPNLHCVLLGVGTFLSNFILTIDYPKEVFSIQKPND